MTFGKATALTAGFVGAMAFGVWAGPYITHRSDTAFNDKASQVERPALSVETTPSAAPLTRARSAAAPKTTVADTRVVVAPTEPALHARIKPLLKKGADMDIAAEGFRSAEEFAATAHAANNLDVPFLLLKHRVLDEKKSLATAIHESKPDVNAAMEADRARAEARALLASLDL